MTEMTALTHEAVRQRLTRLLGLYVGQGRKFSVDVVADTSEIEARTIKAYRGGETLAPADKLLRLMAVMPLAFAADLLAPCGLRVTRAEGEAPCHFTVNGELVDMLQALATALRDGRVDHREDPGLRRLALQLAELLQAYGTAPAAMPSPRE